MITYQTEGVEMPAIDQRATTEWIKAVAQTHGKRVGDIAYIFCSDEKILEVNRQYLQHDYYTDIITTANCTASSSTASCTSAASMTRDRANGKSWRKRKTGHWPYYTNHKAAYSRPFIRILTRIERMMRVEKSAKSAQSPSMKIIPAWTPSTPFLPEDRFGTNRKNSDKSRLHLKKRKNTRIPLKLVSLLTYTVS